MEITYHRTINKSVQMTHIPTNKKIASNNPRPALKEKGLRAAANQLDLLVINQSNSRWIDPYNSMTNRKKLNDVLTNSKT